MFTVRQEKKPILYKLYLLNKSSTVFPPVFLVDISYNLK